MIKFFRKIRQQMLADKKITNYSLYAVGEILLVVVGILIALQINNKNESRKLVQKEIEVLQLLQESLAKDLVKFQKVSSFYKVSEKSIKRVLNHLENNLPYEDILATDFFNTTIYYVQSSFTNGPFETLKSSGLELISNTNLRLKIVDVYDDWDITMEAGENRYIELIMDAGLNKHDLRFDVFLHGTFKNDVVLGVMNPTDYKSLKEDKKYIYSLKTQLNLMGWLVEKPIHEATLHGSRLKDLIKNELEQLDK